MNDLYNILRKLPKDVLKLIIFKLMQEDKLSFAELTELHIQHLEELRKGASENFHHTVSSVVDMWYDTKKNRDSNLKAIMHDFVDRGWINDTHENIDKK